VFFAFAEGQAPVVSGVTLDIEPGGVHALVGRNGSGKTTLLKIIQGLYQPQKGRVLLDGADIAQFTRSELSDWLGYVPQESVLFAGTVRDNIISRQPHATDEEIVQASTEAGVHHFIIDLPDGYATEIGEAGSRLSGGQRQRIAIARALVGNPPVVLLDEPSSSLDRHAEHELKQTLIDIAKTRTVIMVSHSPTLLSACDFLYALDRGKLALAGPAREILPRLFGGKAPPPKDDGPSTTPPGKGPGGGAPKPGAKPSLTAGAKITPAQVPVQPSTVAPSAPQQAQATAKAAPKAAAALRTSATPRPTAQAVKPITQAAKPKAAAALRPAGGSKPMQPIPAKPAAKPRTMPVIDGAALPVPRIVPSVPAPQTDAQNTKVDAPNAPKAHKTIRVGAQLRHSGIAPVDHTSSGRAHAASRGSSARERSIPALRRPKSAE